MTKGTLFLQKNTKELAGRVLATFLKSEQVEQIGSSSQHDIWNKVPQQVQRQLE